MGEKEHAFVEDETHQARTSVMGIFCAIGIALSQTWILPVALVADMYRHEDLVIWTVGTMLLPFFLAFAVVSGGFVTARITAQWNHGTYGAMAGATGIVAGTVILFALLSLPGPAYVLWTLAGLLIGAGGALLFLVWCARIDVLESNSQTPIFLLSIILCSALAIWTQYQGLGPVLLITTSVASVVSAILFIVSRQQINTPEVNYPPAGLLPAFLRLGIAFFLFGFVFAVMIMQFLIAHFARAVSWTWVFSLLGIATALIFTFAGKMLRGNDWDGLIMLRFIPIPACIAFFPVNVAGDTFSLNFAMSGATFVLWFFLTLAPLITTSAAKTLRLPFSLIWAIEIGSLSLGASIGIFTAGIIQDVSTSIGVIITGISSMALIVIASDILLTRGSLARIYKHAYLTNTENESNSPEGTLDHRVAMITDAYNLTSREGEVLGILARGHGLNRVQETLYIAEGTAITHRRHIYQKLGIHSKTELIDFVTHYGDEHCDDD